MSLFRKKESLQQTGVVERFGPHHVDGQTPGYLLVLQNVERIFMILDGLTPSSYPVGLTQVGDRVQFTFSPRGSVQRRTFRNFTLEQRCPEIAEECF